MRSPRRQVVGSNPTSPIFPASMTSTQRIDGTVAVATGRGSKMRQACPANPTIPTAFFLQAMRDHKVERSLWRQFETLHELLNLL